MTHSPGGEVPVDLRVLFVEDSSDDVELMLRRLRDAGIEPAWRRVQSEAALREALAGEPWDIALVDYNLPGFGGLQALVVLADVAPDVPALTVSGAITEETAVDTITAGAVDYILKDNLTRLAPAVRRAVEGADLRREQRRAALQAEQTMHAIEHSSQAVAYVSEDGTILYSNESARRLGTVDPEGIVGQKIWGWSPIVDERVWAELWQAASRGPVIDFESTIRLPEGAERVISATLDFQHGGEDRFVIVYARDITDQREAEQRAATSEARYQRLTDNAPDIVFRYEILPTARLAYINPAVESITGFTPEECYADPQLMFTTVHPEDAAAMTALMESLVLPDEPLLMRWVGKDGVTRWMESRLVAVRDALGRLVAVEGITRDVTERKLADDALRESEARYRAVFEQNRAVKLVVDPETAAIVDANPAACDFYGYSLEGLLALRITDINTAPEAQVSELLSSAGGGLVSGFIAQHRLASGKVRDVEVNTGPFELDGRTLVFSIVHDVTERRRAEEALQKSEAMYRRIVDLGGEGIWGMDAGYRTTFVNPQMAAMLGYGREEMVGRLVTDFMFEEDLGDHGARMEERRRGDAGRYLRRFRRQDGGEVWTAVSSTAELGPEGQFLGSFGMLADVTEQKRAEEALQQNEAHLRTLIDTLPDLVWLKDPQGVYLSCNRRFESFFGAAVSDIVGKTDYDFVDVELADAFRSHDTAAMEAGEPTANEEEITFAEDGHREVLETIKTPVRAADGRLIGILGVGRDITERKRAEDALRQSEDRFRRVSEATSDFAYSCVRPSGGSCRIDWLTGAVERMTGWTREELLDWGCWKPLVIEEDVPLFEQQVAGLAPGASSVCELRIRDKQGRVRWLAAYSEVEETAEEPSVRRLHGACQDITERRVAEDALRESEERFEGFAAHFPGYLFMQDAERRYVYVNRHEVKDGHIPRGAWLGKTPSQVWEGDAAVRAEGRVQRALDGEVVDVIELWAPPGVREYLHTIYFPVRRPGKAPLAGGLSLNVTEQVEAKEEVRRQAERLRRTVEGAVLAMSLLVETRDPYTAGHERRVAELATAIGAEMGLKGEELAALRLASLIHDIGKVAVPSEILSKPGRLSQIELDLIKQHPESGFEILVAIDFGLPVAALVLQHHERLDGSGYPRALAGDAILPGARILAVADVVEAMSSHRPYRPALGVAAALVEIREHAGVKYDADVVAVCARLFEEQGFEFSA